MILGALLACAAVVVLPVQAWGDTSTTPAYQSGAGYEVGHYAATVTFADSGRTASFTMSWGAGEAFLVAEIDCHTGGPWTSSDWRGMWVSGSPADDEDPSSRWYTNSATSPLSHSYTCPAGRTATVRLGSYLNSGTYGLTHGFYGPASYSPAVPSTCSSSFSSPRVSYIGGVLGVRFTWTGALPSHGWKVGVPGDGSSVVGSSPTATVAPTLIGSTPGEYGVDATTTLSGVDATTPWRIESANVPACYVTGTVSTSDAATSTPGSGASDSSGADCGLNPFCYVTAALRWAFVPDPATETAWSDRMTSIRSSPPVAFASGGLGFVNELLTETGCSSTTVGCIDTGTVRSGGVEFSMADPTGSYSFDPVTRAGQCMQSGSTCPNDWGPRIYGLLKVAVVAPFVFFLWRRFSASFGGRE